MYMFEFHAFKTPRWNKAARSDNPKCIVRLVKEVASIGHTNFTVRAIAEGEVVAMDWHSSFPVKIEPFVTLNEKEKIDVRLDDGELQGGWLTTFAGVFIAPTDYDTPCPLTILIKIIHQ